MDNLERIAWLRVQLDILTDLAPEGEWRDHKLLQKWRNDHYSLTRREMTELCNYLNHHRQLAAIAAFDRKYEQLSFLEDDK